MINNRKKLKRVITMAMASALMTTTFVTTFDKKVMAAAIAPNAVNQTYEQRFQEMYSKIHDSSNGYFSSLGIPYHSVETFMVEAPDYGHESTSEAFSYYMWLEAMNGKFTGDFSGFKKSWDTAEKYMIPSHADQPAMSTYKANKPATYAPEFEDPSKYPAKLDTSAPVGTDPLDADLKNAYGTSDVYGMHWLLDVDNWYGYGSREDGKTSPSFVNSYQRGPQESVFETIPQPCWDAMKYGGKNGYLDLFTGDNSYSKQFKYTDAPDADARAVQATYYADKWAKEDGQDVSQDVSKASKMGDYLRYSMFDKYFRKIGASAQAGTGYDAAHYLLGWYYAWGGDAENNSWSWKIGGSASHFGYQNPLTAWVMSSNSDFKPKSQNGTRDWGMSLKRQLEFYQWLQSSEGAIAGGASNSNNGRYEPWDNTTSTFYGMGYQENPVYADPGSNTWFGMQTWSMQRVAQYYYETKDITAKNLLDKWVKWANSTIQFNKDGSVSVPSTIDWSGQPDTWTGISTGNPKLHVKIVNYSTDIGVESSLANTLSYYAAATGDQTSKDNAKKILDSIWTNDQDSKGVSVAETANSYSRIFNQEVYVPQGWDGKMPNGDEIKPGIKFIDIRSKYKNDPDYARVKAAVDAGQAPVFKYHRFWAQSEFAIANGTYAMLFPDQAKTLLGDVNDDGTVDISDVVALRNYIVNGTGKIDLKNADVNKDGTVDISDVVALEQQIIDNN
ncbi:glycoside hydrolase family 48 protein [Clostridium hydrogenum]|uniref:glycoside hydrolase family 48 protein n=1 Tax=Clostridium hydrogenum TaxID=2855764 RepID=UPI001F3969B1|nr:glycoside hydrolase family 48 protein [Clostridium hydrogenum]